jgi:hypothetical protein
MHEVVLRTQPSIRDLPSWRKHVAAQSQTPARRVSTAAALVEEALERGAKHVASVALTKQIAAHAEVGQLAQAVRAIEDVGLHHRLPHKIFAIELLLGFTGGDAAIAQMLRAPATRFDSVDFRDRLGRLIWRQQDSVDWVEIAHSALVVSVSELTVKRLRARSDWTSAWRVQRATHRLAFLEELNDRKITVPTSGLSRVAPPSEGPLLSRRSTEAFRERAHVALLRAAVLDDATPMRAADDLLVAQDIDEPKLLERLSHAAAKGVDVRYALEEVAARVDWRRSLKGRLPAEV